MKSQITLVSLLVLLFCSCATRRGEINIETMTQEQLNQIVREKNRSLIEMCKRLKINPESDDIMPNGAIEALEHRFRLSNRFLFLVTNEHEIVSRAFFTGVVDPADGIYRPPERRKGMSSDEK